MAHRTPSFANAVDADASPAARPRTTRGERHALAALALLVLAVPLAACKSKSSEPSSSERSPSATTTTHGAVVGKGVAPCDLVTKADVESIFGGTVGEVTTGIRGCTFPLSGVAVDSVTVHLYSTKASSEGEGIREGYVDNRDGVVNVTGIGDSAYAPKDLPKYELIVQKHEIVFAVQTIDFVRPYEDDPSPKIRALAAKIASRL